jgi:hypothetical protein
MEVLLYKCFVGRQCIAIAWQNGTNFQMQALTCRSNIACIIVPLHSSLALRICWFNTELRITRYSLQRAGPITCSVLHFLAVSFHQAMVAEA